MPIVIVRSIAALTLVAVLWPATVSAQPAACRFVLGFAELRAMIGPAEVGDCIADQIVTTYGASQETTAGVFAWRQDRAVTLFVKGERVWINGPVGLQARRGDEYFDWEVADGQQPLTNVDGTPSLPVGAPRIAAQTVPPIVPAPAPAPARSQQTEQNQAEAQCFEFYGNTRGASLFGSPADQRQAEAEANAGFYLCGQAVDAHGMKGFDCFSDAWTTARGMERVFHGSGRQSYDEKFAACISRR